MQSYQAYTENGRVIPIGNPPIPDGCDAIVTILNEARIMPNSMLERQKKALCDLEKELAACDEPLPAEFDEILSRRVNIARELEL
jgi:hypothetical protein